MSEGIVQAVRWKLSGRRDKEDEKAFLLMKQSHKNTVCPESSTFFW